MSDSNGQTGRVLVVRHYRNIIQLSGPGRAKPPSEVVDAILPRLQYLHKRSLHGKEAFDSQTGERRHVEVVCKRLFYWQDGLLHCPRGFVDHVEQRAGQLGWTVRHVVLDDDRARPDAYRPDPDVLREYDLREGQPAFFQTIMRRVEMRRGGIVKAVPAFGKSFCLKVLARLYPHARVLVLVPSIPLLRSVADDMSRSLPAVGVIGDGSRTVGRVVVASAHSMGSIDDEWDIVLADEFHEMAADKRSAQFARVTSKALVFGLTATPSGRLDGGDAKLEGMAGPVIYEFNWDEALDLDRVSPVSVRWHDVRLLSDPADGRFGVERKRLGIWRNVERNRIIARSLVDAAADDKHVLALVGTVEHALFLQQAFLEVGLPPFCLSYSLRDFKRFDRLGRLDYLGGLEFGPIDPVELARTRERFRAGEVRRLIATGTLGVGFSVDSLDVVVRADGLGGSAIGDEQKGGRVCRKHGDKDVGWVYDYLDQFNRGFHQAALGRRAIYRGLGWDEEAHQYLRSIDRPRSKSGSASRRSRGG